jgi:hypothetical protein
MSRLRTRGVMNGYAATLREWASGLPPKHVSLRMNRPILSSCRPPAVPGGTMPISLSKLRFSWIALAAFVGASLVTGDASAACGSMMADGGCRPACCCQASESVTPVRAAPAPATVRLPLPFQIGGACPNAAGCHCRPQAPPAPEPKGQRAEESRPDPGRSPEAGWLDLGCVFRPFIGLVPPTGSPPQKSPLYLRHSRLLI